MYKHIIPTGRATVKGLNIIAHLGQEDWLCLLLRLYKMLSFNNKEF